jgi:hypothetical protein
MTEEEACCASTVGELRALLDHHLMELNNPLLMNGHRVYSARKAVAIVHLLTEYKARKHHG